jgi:iron complex outermembrane receptor protein
MSQISTRVLRALALAGTAATGTFITLSPAHAQSVGTPVSALPTGADQVGESLGDIVVTAQRFETTLQKTPIAISVLDADALEDRHILSLVDLGDGAIPGLRVVPFGSRRSALLIGIRGVGALSDANQPARDPGVGTYLDGVYLGRAQGLGAALYDIERIEVLKGPQGTLFGRNTMGGALSIVTRKPSGELGMSFKAGVGNYGSYEAVARLDLPRAGNISLKFDGVLQKRNGTINNPLDGPTTDFNSYDRWGFHTAALWEPSDRFSGLLQFDISRDASTPDYLQLLAAGAIPRAPIISLQPGRVKEAVVGTPQRESVGDTYGVSLNLDWTLDDALSLRSTSSYRSLDQSQYDNGASIQAIFSPNATFARDSQANIYQHQLSQELQLIGELSQLTFVGGLFYYHESVRDDAWSLNTLQFNSDGTGYSALPTPIASTPFPDRASSAKTDNAAAFGQVTYSPALLDDRFHLTLGGRYSHDRKKGRLTHVNGTLPIVNGVAAPVLFDASFDRFDPLINMSYDITDSVMVYGKWSTGHKSGGANARSLTYRPFEPESVSLFEIGAKSELLDRRVRLNVAAYTGHNKDVQIDFAARIPGATRSTLETTNTEGSGRIAGIEVDASVVPVAGLTLSGAYAYNYVRLPDAPNPFVDGSPLVEVHPIHAPKNSASGAIDYRFPIGGATILAHLDANYADGHVTSGDDPTRSDSSFIVNGRLSLAEIGLNNTPSTLQLSIWSRNLLNEQYVRVKRFISFIGTYGIYNEPRTFGVDATIRF